MRGCLLSTPGFKEGNFENCSGFAAEGDIISKSQGVQGRRGRPENKMLHPSPR